MRKQFLIKRVGSVIISVMVVRIVETGSQKSEVVREEEAMERR